MIYIGRLHFLQNKMVKQELVNCMALKAAVRHGHRTPNVVSAPVTLSGQVRNHAMSDLFGGRFRTGALWCSVTAWLNSTRRSAGPAEQHGAATAANRRHQICSQKWAQMCSLADEMTMQYYNQRLSKYRLIRQHESCLVMRQKMFCLRLRQNCRSVYALHIYWPRPSGALGLGWRSWNLGPLLAFSHSNIPAGLWTYLARTIRNKTS